MGPPGSPGRRCPPVLSSSMANLRRRKLLCLGLRGPWPGLSCSHCTPNTSRETLRPCWVNGCPPFLQSFSPCGAFCLSRDLFWHRAMNLLRSEALQKLSHFREDLKVHKRVYTGSIKDMVECMYGRNYQQGSYIIKQGEPGNHIFVLAGGLHRFFQSPCNKYLPIV